MKMPALQNPGAADPVGMILTAVVGICGLFGLFTYLQWDADQVGALLGFLGLLTTGGRTVARALRAGEPVPDGSSPTE